MGCVFILGNLASSKFIVGCLMVHGAVLESMVWCTILVLILISLRRSLILKLKGLIFGGYFDTGFHILFCRCSHKQDFVDRR